jgi:hypothetical protein
MTRSAKRSVNRSKTAKRIAATETIPLERLSYSPREFAGAAGISPSLLYQMWRDGNGPPSRKLGKRRVIEAEAGRRWLAEVTR